MILVDFLLQLAGKLGIEGFCNFILLFAALSFFIFHISPLLIAFKLKKIAISCVNDGELYRAIKYLTPLFREKFDNLEELEITEFINTDTMINFPGKRKIAQIIPGLLTAFGILGTFIGLVGGLVAFNVSDIETLKTSINLLMEGIRLAFLTSIVAIFSSIVWSFMDKFLLRFYHYRLEEFYSIIKSKFKFKTDTASVHSGIMEENFIEKLNECFEKGFEKFAVTLKNEFTGEMEKLSVMNRELREIQQGFVKEMDGVCSEMQNFRKEASILINHTRDINKDTSESLALSVKTVELLKEETENLIKTSRSSENVQKELQKWSENIVAKIDQVTSNLDRAASSITRQSDATERNWTECKTALEKVANGLQNSVKEFSSDTTRTLNDVLDSFDKNFSSITSKLSSSMNDAKEVIEELPGIMDEFSKALKNNKMKDRISNETESETK